MYDKAVHYCKKAEKKMQPSPLQLRERSVLYNLMGNTYKDLKNFPMALEYHDKSLKIRKDTSLHLSIAPAINNIGNVYYESGNYLEAINYFNYYRQLAQDQKSKKKLARAYENLAKTQLALGQPNMANQLLDSSEGIFQELQFKSGLLSIHSIRSDVFLISHLKESESEALSALALAKSIGQLHRKLEIYKQLEIIYQKQEDYKKAFDYALNFQRLNDSLNGVRQLGQVYTYEMVSRLEQRDKIIESEVERSRQRTIQLILATLVALFLAALAFQMYRRFKEKQLFINDYFASDSGVILKSGELIKFDDILRVETLRNDLFIFTIQGLKLEQKNTTLKSFIPSLPKIQFGRPQRGIIVNFNFITKVWKTKLDLLQESINVSATYRDEFLEGWEEFKRLKGI